MLNIDNKISPLPIWCYISRPLCTFAQLQQTTFDFSEILHQQCIVYWQSTCQILVESVYANNSYSSFCEVASKCEVSSIRQSFV